VSDFIKAISLWQPWASLWLSPNKIHETRHWATPHRGWLVHAAKRIETDVDTDLLGICNDAFGGHWVRDLPKGAIIGMVDLLDVIPTAKLYAQRGDDLTSDDRVDLACGNFEHGRFGWRRGTYWVFREPVRYRGLQSLFKVPREVVASAIATAREVCG